MYFFGKTTPDERELNRLLVLGVAALGGVTQRLESAKQAADIKPSLANNPLQQQRPHYSEQSRRQQQEQRF